MHAKQNFVFFTLYIRLMQFFLFFLFFLINCRIFISVFNFSSGQKPFSLGECQINDRHFDHRILICTLWEKEIWKAKWNIDRRTYFDLIVIYLFALHSTAEKPKYYQLFCSIWTMLLAFLKFFFLFFVTRQQSSEKIQSKSSQFSGLFEDPIKTKNIFSEQHWHWLDRKLSWENVRFYFLYILISSRNIEHQETNPKTFSETFDMTPYKMSGNMARVSSWSKMADISTYSVKGPTSESKKFKCKLELHNELWNDIRRFNIN